MNFLKIAIFTIMIIALFVYVSEVLTKISGQAVVTVAVEGVNPEAGEAIFWGKGKCHTCHSIGGQGSAIRCPNLGEGSQGPIMAIRAEERAKEQGLKSGTEYLIESLSEPGAYVVEGFKNEMPLVYKPPILLQPDEIKAVISYLQSLGGEVDIGAIKLPEV
ncbi:cytochrome c, partial [candidate division TA06 bacterium]|nr:cytochrome c [candidate division TA06 bacterium]